MGGLCSICGPSVPVIGEDGDIPAMTGA